jgi:tRNA threonylcarbamoyladenosine biosynthesis protein TsaB
MNETWLLIETSGRTGRIGVARADAVIRERTLEETRRLARDLAPAVGELLREEQVEPKAIAGVMVSVGPGSYTGLRVGIMAAKAFAYATGCKLIAVPTFAAFALQVRTEVGETWVIGDALQGAIYLQRFSHGAALDELRIERAEDVLPRIPATARFVGPGLAVHPWNDAGLLLEPSLDALFRVGRALTSLSRDELFALEPLYLRGSSAEEKAKANEPRNASAARP